MLPFDEWRVSKFYQPRVLGDGEDSQDPADMRKMHLEDQKEQYAKYVALHEPKDVVESAEEKRVTLQLEKLRNPEKDVTLQPLTPLRNNDKSRAEYMRSYRRKPKYCPHCKKQI